MSAVLVAAGVSLAWPALSLFELAASRNVIGSVGAIGAALYLKESPLLAYGSGAAIFAATTYYAAKSDKNFMKAYNIAQAYEKGGLAVRGGDLYLLGGYLGSNKLVAIFVTSLLAGVKQTAGS